MARNTGVEAMHEGLVSYFVLRTLRRGKKYSGEILAKCESAHFTLSEGTLYPLLNRLSDAGFLTYRWHETPSGPPRKYYSLNKRGRTLLNQMNGEWRGLERVWKML